MNNRITSGHKCENPPCGREFDRDERVNPHKRFCSTACRVEYHRMRTREALERLEEQERKDA